MDRSTARRLAAGGLAIGVLAELLLDGPAFGINVPKALGFLPADWREEPLKTGYVLGRQILIPAKRPGMSLWREILFAGMVRLSGSAMEYYHLPPGRVVELGSQVEI